jgi:imidazole glycerol-phosphate synthase subunit HisH
MQNIVIVDYGMGNLNSVSKKLYRLGVQAHISSDPNEILKADKIILPGVGNFKKAMENLQLLNLTETLNEIAIVKREPVLGICLGMQLMAESSEEGHSQGLGWFNGKVKKFTINDTLKHKIPHMGWNEIKIKKNSALMKNIPDLAKFYFVHSFHFNANDNSDVLNETEYEYIFTSAIEKENIFGVQYHPEKSHDAGDTLFQNFVNL